MTMLPRRKSKRMYAVSCDGIGIISGTLAYSRRDSIALFLIGDMSAWEVYKRAGYRTVVAMVKVIRVRR